jgi:hypothetical protein
MTRETLAGAVVSCSFVTLVGVVVFVKMKEGDPRARLDDAQASIQAVAPDESLPLAADGHGPESTGPAERKPPRIIDPSVQRAALSAGRSGNIGSPPPPAPPVTATAPAATAPTTPADGGPALGGPGIGSAPSTPATIPSTDANGPGPRLRPWDLLLVRPIDPRTLPDQPDPAAGNPVVTTTNPTGTIGTPPPPPLSAENHVATTVAPSTGTGTPPPVAPATETPGQVRSTVPPLPEPPPPAPGLGPEPAAAPEHVSTPSPAAPADPGAALQPPVVPSAADATQSRPAPIPETPSTPPAIPATPAAPVTPIPPIGTQPGAVAPPIPAPGPSGVVQASAVGGPVVDSFDEETYYVRPGDSFRSISEQFYRSPRYERALLLFNRDHPRTSDSIRQEPPVLNPGQAIFIPPDRVLEKQFPATFNQGAPLPSGPAPGPVGLDAPRPVAPAAGGTPSTSWSPPSGPSYRVRPGGETFLDIARHTLGSSDRWADIYRLNGHYSPTGTVPAGSVLVLPPSAQVEAEDRPQ